MKYGIILIALILSACEVDSSHQPPPLAGTSEMENASGEATSTESNEFCAQISARTNKEITTNPFTGGECDPPKAPPKTKVIFIAAESLAWDEGNWDEEVWK